MEILTSWCHFVWLFSWDALSPFSARSRLLIFHRLLRWVSLWQFRPKATKIWPTSGNQCLYDCFNPSQEICHLNQSSQTCLENKKSLKPATRCVKILFEKTEYPNEPYLGIVIPCSFATTFAVDTGEMNLSSRNLPVTGYWFPENVSRMNIWWCIPERVQVLNNLFWGCYRVRLQKTTRIAPDCQP